MLDKIKLVAHPRGAYHSSPDTGLVSLTSRKSQRITAADLMLVANENGPRISCQRNEGLHSEGMFAMVSDRVAQHSWRLDQPLYKNADTGLPCTLGPYWISKEEDGWLVSDADEKISLGRSDDFFAAFRILVDAYEKWWRKNCNPCVYFIGPNTEKTTLVKIGYALNVKARLSAIQTGNPVQMRILATVPGGRELESRYHRRFKAQRRKGEWFVINGAIQSEIARLTQEAR